MDIDFGKPKYYNKELFSLRTDDIKGAQPKKVIQTHVKLLKGNNSYGVNSLLKSEVPEDIDKEKFQEFVEKFSPSKKLNPETLLPYDYEYDDRFKPGKRQYENNTKNQDSLDYFKQEYQLKLEEAQMAKMQKMNNLTLKPNESDRKIVLTQKIQDYAFVDPFKKQYDSVSSTPSGQVNTQFSNNQGMKKSPSAKLYTEVQTTEASHDPRLNKNQYLQAPQQQYSNLVQDQNYQKNYDNFYRGYTPQQDAKDIPFNINNPAPRYEKPQVDEESLKFKKNMEAFFGASGDQLNEDERYALNEHKFFGVSHSNLKVPVQNNLQQKLQQMQRDQQQQLQMQPQQDSGYQKNMDAFYRGYTPDKNSNYNIYTSPVQKEQKQINDNDPKFKKNADAFYGGGVINDDERFKVNEKKFYGYSTNSSLGGDRGQQQNYQQQQNFQPIIDPTYAPVTKSLPNGYRKVESFDLISGLPQVKVMPFQGVRIPGEASKSQSLSNTKSPIYVGPSGQRTDKLVGGVF